MFAIHLLPILNIVERVTYIQKVLIELRLVKTKALFFDFDGLILDTETPEFQVWQDIYHEYGQELQIAQWGVMVGGFGRGVFDAAAHLAELVGNGLDADELRTRHKAESDALVLSQPVLPGVIDTLDAARRLGLCLAVASSSPHGWVDAHLTRLGLASRFDAILCSEDVSPGRTKPYPDLFLKALEALHVQPWEAIVFEDSLNGVQAARAAGIVVVAVPNPITALLGVDGADLTIPSLAAIPLTNLLNQLYKL
ncbi:MAG: HAD family hydrolase [Anaerolineales bacterium]